MVRRGHKCRCCNDDGACELATIITQDIELVEQHTDYWYEYSVFKMPDYLRGQEWGGFAEFSFVWNSSSGSSQSPTAFVHLGNPVAGVFDVTQEGYVRFPQSEVLGQYTPVVASFRPQVTGRLLYRNTSFAAITDELYFYLVMILGGGPNPLPGAPPLGYTAPADPDWTASGGYSPDSFKVSIKLDNPSGMPTKRAHLPYVVTRGTPAVRADVNLGLDPLYPPGIPVSQPTNTTKSLTIQTYSSDGALLDTQTKSASGTTTVPVGLLAPSETEFDFAFEYQWNNAISGTLTCGNPCGTEAQPLACPATVRIKDCPSFWLAFDTEPYGRRAAIDIDLNGNDGSLVCGSVSVFSDSGATLLSQQAIGSNTSTTYPVPANSTKVQVVTENAGIKPNPLGECSSAALSVSPLLTFHCPSQPCQPAFSAEGVEVTLSCGDLYLQWAGGGMGGFDGACNNPNADVKQFFKGSYYNGTVSLSLVSSNAIGNSGWQKKWRYTFPAALSSGCEGHSYVEVAVTASDPKSQFNTCAVELTVSLPVYEQREKLPVGGTAQPLPSTLPDYVSCADIGCSSGATSTGNACLYRRFTQAGGYNVSTATTTPSLLVQLDTANISFNKMPFCSLMSVAGVLPLISSTGATTLGATIEWL